jgi:spore coat polysaccharide biosynthesis predicted glycosyltransferase SpsG
MGDVRIFRNISDMAARMAEADLAIGGGGTTSWERCCLGLPAIVATLALNQASINRALEKDGLVIHLGTLDHIRPRDWGVAIEAAIGDRRRLADMSRRTMELVDGLGAARVADAMERME